MKGARPKPPQKSKAELAAEVKLLLAQRYTPDEAMDFIMGYFTALDLELMRNALKT